MQPWIKMFISGLIAGLITFGTSLAAIAINLPAHADTSEIGSLALLISVIGGALATLKDWQAYLSTPPHIVPDTSEEKELK